MIIQKLRYYYGAAGYYYGYYYDNDPKHRIRICTDNNIITMKITIVFLLEQIL